MVYPYYIPQSADDWKTFKKEILESEALLRTELRKSELAKGIN